VWHRQMAHCSLNLGDMTAVIVAEEEDCVRGELWTLKVWYWCSISRPATLYFQPAALLDEPLHAALAS
jgi:hypothetical protein